MDFNDFIADLRTAGNEFCEKISDKYAATMAYCETACKGLDRLERDAGPYENQVIGLWMFLGCIQETYPKLTSGPAINALCQKIFRHCARTVLNIQWQQLDENSTSRQNFEITLQSLNQCLSATGYTRFALILSLMDSGWTRPILSQVMAGEEDTDDGEGLKYIINEDPVILKIRVEMMLQENCEEFALNLCSWCLKHPALKDDLDIRQTQLMLFHKLNNSERLQEECQKIPCHDGVRLISRMRQMEKYKSLCTRLAQIFLVQDWIRQSEHCCTKDLLKLWIRHQYLADRDKEKFLNSVWAIAKLSCVTEQILLMIDALKLECGDMFLQLYTDLCIFAINFDKSCLEKHMQDGDMEGLRTRQQAMASTCEKLANVYLKNDTKITRYSAVTSFALNPSAETLSFVEKFYLITSSPYVIDRGKQTHEAEKCCTNCFRGEGMCQYKKAEGVQSDANVDVATLLEVERLLSMLRPFYLNPDMQWTELKPLCERFLHERERLAQKFAMEIDDTPSTDVSNSVVKPLPSSLDQPATSTMPSIAPPASALIPTSSTPVIQQQNMQSSQTMVHLPQNVVRAISIKPVQQTVSTQNVAQHVSKSVTTQNVLQHLPKSVSSWPIPQVPKTVTTQPIRHFPKSVSAQNVPQSMSRPVLAQNVQPVSNQQVFAHPVNRLVSKQQVHNVSKPVSTHYAPQVQVTRPLYTQHITQQSVTSGSYTPVTATSQQSLVQQDTSSLVGIEPSVMLSEDKNLIIRNLLFTNEEISLADFPDADALVELLQQALPGGGTELPETLQDISIDSTGIGPALHIVQDSPISEQMKRTVQTDSNFVSVYSTSATGQAVPTSLHNTSHVSVAGGNTNSLTHSMNLVHGLSVPVTGMSTQTTQSTLSSATDVAGLVNIQTVLEMPHTGIQSSGHSLKQSVNKPQSYTIVTQAGMVTTNAPSQTVSVSRSNIPIQPRVTQSTVLRPGVAGVAQQGIGTGQHVQAVMTKSVPNMSSQTLSTIRMAAMGSHMENKVVETSLQSLHFSSLPGKPVVSPKSYPNISTSFVHSDAPVAQNSEQVQHQQHGVSSLTQNSLKKLLYQQSMASLRASNAQLYAQQVVSGSSQKSQNMSFDAKHVGSVQRTVKALVDEKQGDNVHLSQELMQNILTGGTVQVIPSSSSMLIGAPPVANILQTPAAAVSQSPALLYTTTAPTPISVYQSTPHITEYNQAVSSLEINQQSLHATTDLSAVSSVIALLNLQSQALAQTKTQSASRPKSSKTLKTAFNEFQKNKSKKRNPSHSLKQPCENENIHVKSVENTSKESTLANRLNFGTSVDVPQEPVLSMHLHGIPASFAPPPRASVLEQTVTCADNKSLSVASTYGQTSIQQQNTTTASTKTGSTALLQHLHSARPALVQESQQLQHVVGVLPQHLQQPSVTVIPSTGQTQSSVVQQAQTIFIPAVGQQNSAAVFQPAAVGQLTLVHQVPNQTLFTQPGILQAGIQVSNVCQMAVSKEPSSKHSSKFTTFTSVNDTVKTSTNKQTCSGDVSQPTTTSMSKAHVPFMLASRLCSSSSKKYMSSSQSKSSQNNSKTKSQSTTVKEVSVASKAGDFSPFPISAKSNEVSSQLESFLLNSVLTKQSNTIQSAAISGPLLNVQGQFQHGVQSTESLKTQPPVPYHTVKHNTHSEKYIQVSALNQLGHRSDCLEIPSSRSGYIVGNGAQVPVGFTQQYVQGGTLNTNDTAVTNLNSALTVLTSKNVQEKFSDQVVHSFFSETEAQSHADLLTIDEPYLIETVSSRDLEASQVYDLSSELPNTPTTPSHSVSALSAENSKPDVQKKRIVSKRLFATKFRCMICSEVFEKMEDLREHVKNPCTPGEETSDEKINRISACEEALKKQSPYPKSVSDKPPTITKKSLEACRVYECPVCKVLCKTDEEVLHHRFDCLKSKSKPRQRKPKVPATDNATTGSSQIIPQTSTHALAMSAGALQDSCFNSGSMSLTTLSPLSSNSCGIVSPVSVTTALISPMSSAVISPPPPPVVTSTSVGSSLALKTAKSVGQKSAKVRRVPHTGLLGTRPKPPPKPMTPERIADLLLVWRTVEWVRAALGVAAPSVRIKALDLARSNSTPSTDPPDSKLVEALDIDKSVVAKIKVYEENQRKFKNKKKKKSPSKADSCLDSIASMKSVAKSVKKEKAPPKKKKEPSHSVVPSTNIKETNLNETETKRAETPSDSKQSNPVKRKRPKKKPEPKFQILEHLGRKYYKCGLCGQTFCNLDFMVTEHWEKCLSQNPKQRKTKPGGPGDKKVQKIKTNKETNSVEDKAIPTATDSVEATPPAATKENKSVIPEPLNKPTSVTESNIQSIVEESFEKKLNTGTNIHLPSIPLSAKVDPPHIDFNALLKETFSIALGKRPLDALHSFDDESHSVTAVQHIPSDIVSGQTDQIRQNISNSNIPFDTAGFLQKSDNVLATNLNFFVPSSQQNDFTEINPDVLNINEPSDFSRPYTESQLKTAHYETNSSSVTLFKLQDKLEQIKTLRSDGEDTVTENVDISSPMVDIIEQYIAHQEEAVQNAILETSSSILCQGNLLESIRLAENESSGVITQTTYKHSNIKPMDVTLTCNEHLEQSSVVDIFTKDGHNTVGDKKHSFDESLNPIYGNKSCDEVSIDEKTTKDQLNDEEHIDDGSSRVTDICDDKQKTDKIIEKNFNSPNSDQITSDGKMIEIPHSSPILDENRHEDKIKDKPCGSLTSDETNYDDKFMDKARSCPSSYENSHVDNIIDKPSDSPPPDENCHGDTIIHKPIGTPTSDKNHQNDKIRDKSSRNQTSDQNSETIKKQTEAENVCEKNSEETNELRENDSLVPLGKKRTILERDAKNMRSGCTFKLKQGFDSNSGRDVSCDACGALFKQVRTLIQHMVSRHLHPKQWTSSSISSIACPFCSLNCCSYMSYMNHLPKHTTVILEKMEQHLLLDSRTKAEDRLAEFLKSKQNKETNSDLESDAAILSQGDSLDAVNIDIDVKTIRKRGRPRKQCFSNVKDDRDMKTQNTEKVYSVTDSVHSGFKSMFLPLEDIATKKPHILIDNSVKLTAENDISVPNTKSRLRKLRGVSLADNEVKSATSRKSFVNECDTERSKNVSSDKTEETVSSNLEMNRCKTRSRKREASPKKVTSTPSQDKRKRSTHQTRSNQIRKNLIKAAQAHVVTQRKKAILASCDCSEKQELKKETSKDNCEKFTAEQPSKKTYSLRNSAHLYIKSRQNIAGLHRSPVVKIREKDCRVQSDVSEKREQRNTCRNDSKQATTKTGVCSKVISVKDSNVKQDKHSAKKQSAHPMLKKKIRNQFLKRYDEGTLCFSKKANCWQAYDRILKTWKFLSDKHFVQNRHSFNLNDEQNTIEHLEKIDCIEKCKNDSSLEHYEQTGMDASSKHKTKSADMIIKTDSELISPVEDSCDNDMKDESDKQASLKSPSLNTSFQDTYMSYLYNVSENKQDDAALEKKQQLDSSLQTPPKKELKGVQSLRSVMKCKSFKWDVDEDSGVIPGNHESVCETLNNSNVMNRNNPTGTVTIIHEKKLESTKLEAQVHSGMQTKDEATLFVDIVKENKTSEQTGNEDKKSLHQNDNSEQITRSISKPAESDGFSNTVTVVSTLVQNCEIPQQTGVGVSDVENFLDQSTNIVSNLVQGRNESDVKCSTLSEPKSLKVIAARMQPPEGTIKSDIALAVGIKSPALSSSKAEPVKVEVHSKTESAAVPQISEKKTKDGAVPQQSDTEEEEDEKKKQRIERSLKSLREKTNIAPFTWDVDDDDRPTCKISRSLITTQLRNSTNIATRAISVGTSATDMLINTRLRRYGDEMKSHVFRKVTRSCSSDSLNLFNKVSPSSWMPTSHIPIPGNRLAAKTDFQSVSDIDKTCKTSKVVLHKSFVSVGTGQSCRTRSCDRRSFSLDTFLQRQPNLDNSSADSMNNTACRKRRLSKSEDNPESKHFSMTVSPKKSVIKTQRVSTQSKYGSSKGQQPLSNVGSLPAVVRRNSHRLTCPINTKPVSNVQFFRVDPTEESQGLNVRSTRNAALLLEERTRHTLMLGEHVQSGPQLRKSDVKKIDQKWVIDKHKHKKASFPYAFTRKRNQWK